MLIEEKKKFASAAILWLAGLNTEVLRMVQRSTPDTRP
jgi:hypothetical protein